MGLTPWERQASMRHSRAHPSAHTHGLLRAPRKAQQTRHASRWQVYMHATLACGPVLHAGRLTLRDPLRPSATLCNPLRPSMTLCKPLRRPAQAQPRHGSACGPARACRTERGAYGGARRAQEGVGLQLRAQPARHCRLALDATPYSQTRTGLKPAALTQDPSAMTDRWASGRATQQPCARAKQRAASSRKRIARACSESQQQGQGRAPACTHEGRQSARGAPRLRPQLLDLRRARSERGVVGVDPRGELGVALRILVAAEDPRAGRQLAQLGQRLPPAPRARQAPPTLHHAGVGFTVHGRRQPWVAQLRPRPPEQHHRLTTLACSHVCTGLTRRRACG